MSCIGNINGPTTEGIIAALSPMFLQMGCPETDLRMDIAEETAKTQHQVIRPALLDEHGRPFIEFSIQGRLVRHFVDEHPSLKET